MDLGLKGKTAVVVGGASGIGRATSITLAGEGANVVIADFDKEQAKKVVGTIEASGGKAIEVKVDATQYNELEAMVKKALGKFGNIDILINIVGWDGGVPLVESTPELWDKIIDLNYKSMLNTVKLVLPHMIERQDGAIVNIGADAGRIGETEQEVYSGAKAAVIGASLSVARTVARHGIRVNVVVPGQTVPESPEEMGEYAGPDHKGFYRISQDQYDRIAHDSYPLRRLGKPQDIADAVVFLASDAARDITGQALGVNGGYTMV
ncbi:SDR family NAD(P)-dependent oxidoreductase [Chloroflexota bacterium]